MIICITGQMASGKNAVANIFEKSGWACVDADILVHSAIENAKDKIIETFSKLAQKENLKITNEDGSINRKELALLLFKNKNLLSKQESIVYPEVIKLTEQFINKNKSKNIAINATVLYKTQTLLQKCDKIVFVKANIIKRFFRAKTRDKMKAKAIISRFIAQRNLYKNYAKSKIKIITIKNNSSKEILEEKTLRIIDKL